MSTAPPLPMKYVYDVRVMSVYDGDTIRLDIDVGFGIWIHDQTVRLFGINAPEVRGSQRPEGLVSRDALRAKIMLVDVRLHTQKDKKGKYGRWLGTLWVPGPAMDGPWENINDWMVDNGYAVVAKY